MSATNGSTAESTGVDRAPARVPIVDDDPRGLEVLSNALTAEGAGVRCAQGVSEATAKLRHLTCDVVLVGLTLPGHGGLDMLRHIRRLHPELAVVVLANPGQESIARDWVDEGAFGYVVRPIEQQTVADCVRDACAASRERRAWRLESSPGVARCSRTESGDPVPIADTGGWHR